jgi:hypothetical protein
MRSNLPTDRLIALVEELTQFKEYANVLHSAIPPELLVDMPPAPALVQHEIELYRLSTDYRERTKAARERMQRMRARPPLNPSQERAKAEIVSTVKDLDIPLDVIVSALKKAQETEAPVVQKEKVEL